MNRRISLGAAIAFMLIVAAATFSATMIYAQNSFNKKTADLERSRETHAKFTEIDRTIRANYGGAINETLLMDSVAQGYVKGIGDKYGVYISAEEYKRLRQNKEGEDVGIGAVTEISPDGYLLVSEVYPDSPAQVAGIVDGDRIVKINDLNLTPENVEQSHASLQGEAGTKLSLVVRRESEDVTIPELTRRIVAIPSVYSRVIDDSVGYIIIKQFNDNTADQFNREFHKVIEDGVDCLIFDVRDNKGSSVSSAVRILDKLVPEGVIYTAIYRDGTIEVQETSDSNEINLPMAVLTNSGTASAAELFAQDLKEYGKASTIGVTTMGKGVILNRIPLSDGSAVDLTIAQIGSKSGTVFDGVGIKADYDIQGESDWAKLDETTDAQLKKALEVVKALRKVEETVQAEVAASSSSEAPAPEPSVAPPAPVAPPASSAPEVSSEESSEPDSESSSEDESSQDESASEEESESSADDVFDKDPEETSSESSS